MQVRRWWLCSRCSVDVSASDPSDTGSPTVSSVPAVRSAAAEPRAPAGLMRRPRSAAAFAQKSSQVAVESGPRRYDPRRLARSPHPPISSIDTAKAACLSNELSNRVSRSAPAGARACLTVGGHVVGRGCRRGRFGRCAGHASGRPRRAFGAIPTVPFRSRRRRRHVCRHRRRGKVSKRADALDARSPGPTATRLGEAPPNSRSPCSRCANPGKPRVAQMGHLP
jgi:hypothetical protein